MASAKKKDRRWISGAIIGKYFRIDEVAVLLIVAFVGAVSVDTLFGFGSFRPLLAFGIFMTLPGALLLTLFGYSPRLKLEWFLYAAGTSLLVIMAVGFLLNLTLSLVGIDRPISPFPLGIAHAGLILGLAVVIRITNPEGRTLKTPDRDALAIWLDRWFQPTTFALLLLPPLTILSVAWLNRTSDNRPLIGVLLIVALLPLVIAAGKIARRWLPLAVWATGISLLYHNSLWVFSRFSGQRNIIVAWQTGSWAITERGSDTAATTPLLPNVTISPTFAHLGGIDIFTQLDVFNPLFVALIPLGSFIIFRRFVDPEFAAYGAILVTFIHPFYFQLPTGGRAATPVLFLVLTAVALTDSELDPVLRQGLALGFAAALVTSHYGASYFAMVGFTVALVFLLGLHLADALIFSSNRPKIASDGGTRLSDLRSVLRTRHRSTLSASFVAFYLAMTFGWYLYTFEGKKFSGFLERVVTAITTFLASGFGGGGTANRLTREYGTRSIELSRYLYMILAILTAIGVCYLLVQRLTSDEWRNHDGFDEYLVLGAGILAVFSLTFLLRAIWGGGRPMAITFSITALFAVIGVYALVAIVSGVRARFLSRDPVGKSSNMRVVGIVFASILAALLVLNSGVAAATVLGGNAPSNVPLQPAIEERSTESPTEHRVVHFEQDVSMLVWLNTHADGETGAFGDRITAQSNNDVYSPQITAGVDPGESRSISWTRNLFEVVDHEEESYVVLSSHNANLNLAENPRGQKYTGAHEFTDMSDVNDEISRGDKLYTNGDAEIYKTSNR